MSLSLLLVGCTGQALLHDTAGTGTGGPAALVTVDAWQLASADPFDAERPDTVDCPDWGYGEELGVFEVETDICHYGSFTQPLLAELTAGDSLALDWWHDALWAEEPAVAHVALGLGDAVLYELTLDVPADADVYRLSLAVHEPVPVGSAVWLHVHNHGANSYRFGALTR